jgi:hypothetical protein
MIFSRMRKHVFISIIICFLGKLGKAQNISYGVFSYAEPATWAKDTKLGIVSYSNNVNAGSYCMIALSSNDNSTGNIVKDFSAQWEKLAEPFHPEGAPQMGKAVSVNGWTELSGAAAFTKEGKQGAIVMSTYSNNITYASVLYVFNDTVYQQTVDEFSTRLKVVADGGANQGANTSSSSPEINYVAPKGWSPLETATGGAGFISPLQECTDNSIYKLYVLPNTSYTGSLQDYAYQMHKAYFYQTAEYIGYQEASKRMVKGTDDKGREYISFETPAHAFNDNTWRYGMVYLLRSGTDMAAFILELKPIDRNKFGPPTSVYNFIDGCAPLKATWKKFLSSVTFPNTTAAKTTVPDELEGTWTSRVHLGWATIAGQYAVENSQVVEKYTFSENGRYVKDEFAKGKTNGTFSISGNKINFTEATGKKYSYPFTLTSTFEYASWQRALSFFDSNGQEIKLNYESVQ